MIISFPKWVVLNLTVNLISAHVHLNEPGRTAWEGFWTGTLAAASGGITTLVDMPLNSLPPTTTVENLETKRDAAQGQCHTDIGFWGGVIPGNEVSDSVLKEDLVNTDKIPQQKAHLKPLVHAGVRGFKCFLMESGVEARCFLLRCTKRHNWRCRSFHAFLKRIL